MTTPHRQDVTLLLEKWSNGDHEALDDLMIAVYKELRRLAERYLRTERPDHTLQATALVHEAYMRLVDQQSVQWQNRAHFFGVAARIMRNILVDHARAQKAAKRGSVRYKLTLDEAIAVADDREVEIVALDDALTSLAEIDPEKSRIVELRFFGGLSVEETAVVLGTSPRTVKRGWRVAKAWLYREVRGDDA
jgi:RNA polymerase sigma factor (TIGR02999 family)